MNNAKDKAFNTFMGGYGFALNDQEYSLVREAWQAATEQSQKEIAGLEAKLNELVKFQSSADRLAMDILDVITDYFGV